MTKNKLSTYKIEKNIPLPPAETLKAKQNSYPFKYMEVGDSFLVDTNYSRIRMQKYSNAARGWAKALTSGKWKFAIRKTDDGIRIWRIK